MLMSLDLVQGWKVNNRYFRSSLLVAVTEEKLIACSLAWKNYLL